jgi:hypothetical protein
MRRLPGETGQCHPPTLIDDDRADRSVEAAAFRAFLARAPRSTDRADEVETRIALRRQRDDDFTLTEFALGVGRFIGHAATMAGKLTFRPEAASEDKGSTAPRVEYIFDRGVHLTDVFP